MTLLTNARIVLPCSVVETELHFSADGLSAPGAIVPAASTDATVIDCEGDYIIPGIIDLHTDNLERQVLPRVNARWPSRSAFLAHDAQCAVAGVTTVFDSLSLGDINGRDRIQTYEEGIRDLVELSEAGALRADHLLHFRCELIAPDMQPLFEMALHDPRMTALLRLASLMDHSPGVGQYADIARWRVGRAKEGMTEAEIDAMQARVAAERTQHLEANRAYVIEYCRAHGITLASHDDRLEEEVARNHEDGITIAEFPVSLAAARGAHALGMDVIAGAPNIVRGGSHSGNVNAIDLIRAGLVTALASDYVPSAMLEAAFACVTQEILPVPEAIALVTDGPARIVGLHDRGRIEAGRRADLVQVRLYDGLPVIRRVWVGGHRVV